MWELKTGECVRILRQELMVRAVAIDDMGRLVTGDSGGYVYVWSLENCLDTAKGLLNPRAVSKIELATLAHVMFHQEVTLCAFELTTRLTAIGRCERRTR